MIGGVSSRHLTVVEKRPRPRTSTGPLPDLQRLRAFIVLAEEADTRFAAVRLGITPSRLNRLVRKLESDLCAALFRRSRHRIELTIAGERLLPPARALLDAAAHLVTDLNSSPSPACDEFSTRRLPTRLSERPV